MTAVFSATWQSLRVGLRASPCGRAAFSTIRASLSTSRQSQQPLQRFHSLQRFPQCNQGPLEPYYDSRLAPFFRPFLSALRKQCRCVSSSNPSPKRKGKVLESPKEEVEEVEINEDEIKRIFGKHMDPSEGTDVLMALQRRRLEGTLDLKMAYPDAWISKGLVYLRARFPMDEDAAIIARIDREFANVVRAPQTNADQSPSAVSQFERLRRENKDRKELERRKREAEEQKDIEREGIQGTKTIQTHKTDKAVVGRQPAPQWVLKYRKKAEEMELPPGVGTMQRLLPTGVLVITVVALSLLFAKYYKPPSSKARLWPEIPPAAATVLAIIGANIIVALMWRIPQLWPFMNTTFIVFPTYPSAKSMIGASFSHHQFKHLLVNMVGLWELGTRLHDDIGRGPFLALYFSAAVLGAYIPMVAYVLSGNLGTATVGASACLYAIIAASCVLHEGRTIHITPLPDIYTQGIDTGIILAIITLMELRGLRRIGLKLPQTGPNVPDKPRADHMGHLTGLVVGAVAAMMVRWKDPKWKDVRREHWYTDVFTRDAEKPAGR